MAIVISGCGWQLPNGGLRAQVGWLGVGVGSHLALESAFTR